MNTSHFFPEWPWPCGDQLIEEKNKKRSTVIVMFLNKLLHLNDEKLTRAKTREWIKRK